jgi:septum formation protein
MADSFGAKAQAGCMFSSAAPSLVLASTSAYRRELLGRLGVIFSALAPLCDEEALKIDGEDPAAQALRLARAKALSLRAQAPHAFILGGDQLVSFAGRCLGKPHTKERAIAQLSAMQGQPHSLLTAIALVAPDGSVATHLDTHVMTMRALSTAELTRYVERDQPLDCAGSYKIEAGGIALFERIEGADFTAIPGLPLIALAGLLRARGFAVP